MEFVEGESLDRVFYRRKKLPWEEVVDIGIHLCAALQHAHDRGIIHRDLKPSNLMMLNDGEVKLTDFGIAKDTDVTALTNANSTVGTAAYMSPEQCRGARDITHKTDLYSMGIMFYELLTGRKPFVGETAMDVFLQHANKRDFKHPCEIALDVPIWLDTLVCQLMEKEPAKRPQNAAAVADSLRLIQEKVEKQRGGDGSKKRKVDREEAPTDAEEDKTEARAVLAKRRKKEAPIPFYAKGIFTVAALFVIALVTLAGIYFVFLRAPSADSLYTQAEKLMRSQSADERKAGREGPVADFLRYYPTHEKTSQVRAFADDYDFDILNGQMHRRRDKGFQVGGKDAAEEQSAREALADEDAGKLHDALKRWTDLSAKKAEADPEVRTWGLVGERYAKKLQDVIDRHVQLKTKIQEERLSGKKAQADGDLEKNALDAVRAEVDGLQAKQPDEAASYFKKAREQWDEMQKTTEKKDDQRHWHLLAAWRHRELKK
jgi:serine/threonine-protein kinase